MHTHTHTQNMYTSTHACTHISMRTHTHTQEAAWFVGEPILLFPDELLPRGTIDAGSLGPLLPRLQTLRLGLSHAVQCELAGLDAVLASCPHLHSLGLDFSLRAGYTLNVQPAPAGLRIASPSLRTLTFAACSVEWLEAVHLPGLPSLEFLGLSYVMVPSEGSQVPRAAAALHRAASFIAAHPACAASVGRTFNISSPLFADAPLYEHAAALLPALAPLGPHLRRLVLQHCVVDGTCVRAVRSLFPGLECLHVGYESELKCHCRGSCICDGLLRAGVHFSADVQARMCRHMAARGPPVALEVGLAALLAEALSL